MTYKEINLLSQLNIANPKWGIISSTEIDTELYFGTQIKLILQGPIIYSYIEKNDKCYYASIAANTIGVERFLIIDIEAPEYAVAIYMINETEE